jgi:hypothetical protein
MQRIAPDSHRVRASCIANQTYGSRIAVTDAAANLTLWDAHAAICLANTTAKHKHGLAFSRRKLCYVSFEAPETRDFATDRALATWDSATWKEWKRSNHPPSPYGTQIIVEPVRVIDLTTGQAVLSLLPERSDT